MAHDPPEDELAAAIEAAMLARIDSMDADIERLGAERDRLVAELQCECRHADVRECSGTPPWRVCMTCGLAEYAWSCGNKLLRPSASSVCRQLPSISFHEAISARRGRIWENHIFIHGDPRRTLRFELGLLAVPLPEGYELATDDRDGERRYYTRSAEWVGRSRVGRLPAIDDAIRHARGE